MEPWGIGNLEHGSKQAPIEVFLKRIALLRTLAWLAYCPSSRDYPSTVWFFFFFFCLVAGSWDLGWFAVGIWASICLRQATSLA